jgi:pimeloyl-ACP methyl ester carboxylesterase
MTEGHRHCGAPDAIHPVVNGLRTCVQVHGDGPPLLLLMGIWGELTAWDPLLAHLSGFRTIAFDAPGIGGTELPGVPLSLPGLARFAVGVLDAVGVRRAHVLGVSFGGLVAQQLAVQAPDRVDRLVLASTASGVLFVPGQPSTLLRLLAPWDLLRPGRAHDPGSLFGGRVRRHPELVADIGLRWPTSLPAYLHRLSGLTGWLGLPWAIRRPTLVLTGDDDPIVPPANSRILAAALPDARIHVVRGGGHLMLFDSPAEVAPVVGTFLRAGAVAGGPAEAVGTLGR